ncbi:MAG TPA: PKD domain-containing protein [Saprospiraceae bacterium]|nr:PKD domain-containing protein [Saprospiraceae bacterium]
MRLTLFSKYLCIAMLLPATCVVSAQTGFPWTRITTGANHTIIVPATLTATWDGMPLENGDAVGFFFERNDSLICSNYLIISGQNASMAVYGNDAPSGKNGFAPGELFKAKIYRASTQQVLDAQAVFAPAGTVIPPLTITHTNMYALNGISLLTQVSATSVVRPQATFDADVVCGTAPLTVQFSDQSSNAPEHWQWDFGNGQSSTEQHPTAIFTEPGIYTVRLIAANAAGQDTLERQSYITAVGQVSVTVLPGDTICAGARLELQAEGAERFVWSGINLETEAGSATAATLTQAGDYVYQAIGITNDCESSPVSVAVHVRPVPVVTLSASADTICRQGALTLTATGASTYVWQGFGLSAASGSVVTVMPDTSGLLTYGVTGTANGCISALKKQEVWVRPRPQITASAERSGICLGDTVTLSAVGAEAIFWNGPGLLSFSGASVQAAPQQTGTRTYQVTGNTAGCPAEGASVSIEVNSNALSASIAVSDCPGPDLMFTATVTNGGDAPNILWFRNGQPVWNGPDYTLFGAQNGMEVYCRVTPVNAPPCTTPSQALSNTVIVNCIASETAELLPGIRQWSVFPNPNEGWFFVSVANTEAVSGRLRVWDMLGRPVWEERVQWSAGHQVHRIELPGAAPGVYWVGLESLGQVMRKGVVVR